MATETSLPETAAEPLDAPQDLLTGCFHDRVVLITGAAGDIGLGMARAFAALGARIALLDIDLGALEERVTGLSSETVEWMRLSADVSDAGEVSRTVHAVLDRWKRIDVLINSASVLTPMAPIDALDVDTWNRAVSVNLTGTFLMCRAVVPSMRTQKRGVIINVASQMAHVGSSGRSAYTASKAAVINLTRTLALDHAEEGIRAVSLSPGAIRTGRPLRIYGSIEAAEAALAPLHPMHRLGRVEEVALAAVYLASDAASFITGTDLAVDGGYLAQ